MVLSKERGGLGAAFGDDNIETRDFFAVHHQVKFFFFHNRFEVDAFVFKLLAESHRDHKGLLVGGDAIADAQYGGFGGKSRGGKGKDRHYGAEKLLHH